MCPVSFGISFEHAVQLPFTVLLYSTFPDNYAFLSLSPSQIKNTQSADTVPVYGHSTLVFYEMYKRKRKSKKQERREEATGEEPTDTVAQPTPLQAPPSDEILPTTEAAIDAEEEEQVPQNAPLPVISKRCRLVTAFTDKEEDAIIEFLQNHPEIYNKEHERYTDKYHKEALWVEIATELKLDANDVKRWYTSKRTTFGKVSKNKSGQAPASFTPRQKWVYDRMSFMRDHICRKGENITAGLEASSYRVHNDSTRSSTDVESLDASGRSPFNLGPLSTDHKLLEHCETMKTMVSKFVEKPVDERTLFLTLWHLKRAS